MRSVCGIIKAQAAGEVTEVLSHRQGRRGEDPRAAARGDQGTEALRDIKRASGSA